MQQSKKNSGGGDDDGRKGKSNPDTSVLYTGQANLSFVPSSLLP